MALNIVRVTELPLGRRVLCLGMSGTDVKQLQSLLYQAGFYLYEIDGIYGALTMEAVILAQRAFRLKVDGIAGKIVINALQKIGDRTGRTIYTVKPGDNLNSISEKFGVTPKAWRSLTGQGNPQKKIYLGMKLLLLHKMIFLWNEVSSETFGLNATGQIRDGWEIKTGGLLEAKEELSIDNYQIVTAEAEIWQELMARSNWKELLKQAKQLKGFKIGLDLRRASLKTIWQWEKWLRDLNQVLQLEQIEFLVLPSFLNNKVDSRVFYLNFKKLSQYVKLFFLEEPLNQIDETELGVAKNRVHVIEKSLVLNWQNVQYLWNE